MLQRNGMISPRVLLIEDFNKDLMRIESILNLLEELNVIHFHTEHENSLNFPVETEENTPALRIMYLNRNYSASIFFGENALMLGTAAFMSSDAITGLNAEVNKAGENESVQLIHLLADILDEIDYHACIHN